MESVPIFPAFNILVDSSRNSQKFRCEFGNFNIGTDVGKDFTCMGNWSSC